MSKIKYEYDYMSQDEVKNLDWNPGQTGNEEIVETAGFIPLEVKLKQYEQNGIVAQFVASDFDSNDYRDIFLNPDFMITPEDDIEDIEQKIIARNEYMQSIKNSKSSGNNDKAGTDEHEKDNEKKPAELVKDE